MQCHQVRPHIVSLNKHVLTQCAPEIDWARLIDHFWKMPTEKFSYHASHVSPPTLSPQSCPPPSDCRSGTWVVTGVGWWRVPDCSAKQLNSNFNIICYWQILTSMEPFDKPCCGLSDKISSSFGKNPNIGDMRPSAFFVKKRIATCRLRPDNINPWFSIGVHCPGGSEVVTNFSFLVEKKPQNGDREVKKPQSQQFVKNWTQ